MTYPQAYGQPQYGPPPQGIALTTQYFALSWLFATVKPKVFVNGYEIPVWGWGRTVVPLAPGQYHFHVYTPYFFPTRVGPADLTVTVHPGHFIELEYRTPLWSFSSGSLGSPPQRYNGILPIVAVSAVALLVVVVAMLVLLATG
jgi:hypothetical protein